MHFVESKNVLIQISPRFVHKGAIDDKSTLVQVMAWYSIGNKLLPEAVITQFAGGYIIART